MRAAVWHGVGDVRLDEVPDPTVQHPTEARRGHCACCRAGHVAQHASGWTKVVLEPGS